MDGPDFRQSIDIEALLQWAIGQTGHLPWRGVSDKELAMDHGWTAIPRGVSREWHGAGTLLLRALDDDAGIIVAEIKALEPAIASVVIACARGHIRPDWMMGVVPHMVQKTVYLRKRRGRKKSHRAISRPTWYPCHPDAICAAREIYSRWHAALLLLSDRLDFKLIRWKIKGFSAHNEPWNRSDTNQLTGGNRLLPLPTAS